MKLVIAGATGFVATEVIRQSLSLPSITTVVALARRPVSAPGNLLPGADASKLHSVVVKDYGKYSQDVKKEIAGADACIWTIGVTPSKSRSSPFEEVRRVCLDYTMTGIEAMLETRGEDKPSPLRFLYISGSGTQRDQTKPPRFMPQYFLLRGETETQVLAYAAVHQAELEASIARPGLILQPGSVFTWLKATVLHLAMSLPSVGVVEFSAALLNQVSTAFEKDTLENEDLVRIGSQVLDKKTDGEES